MAKTPTERINELDVAVGRLYELVENVRAEQKELRDRLAAAERSAGETRTEAALLRQTVEDLKRSRDLWSSRWWTILTIVIGCLLTSVFALLRK